MFLPFAYAVCTVPLWPSRWVSALGVASLTLVSAVTLLGTEVQAQAATGAPPLTRRALISAKATLAALVYLLSVGAAAATTAVSGRNAVSLATLALAHAPVVVASVMIFSLLAYVVEEGLPPGDLYSRMLYLLLPFSLGFLTLATPAVAYALALWLLKHPAPLTLLALVALAELAAAALVLAASR